MDRPLKIKIFPFVGAALGWLAILCGVLATAGAPGFYYGAAVLIWMAALLDLLALARLTSSVLQFLNSPSSSEFRNVFAVRALFWGAIKLVMLGTLITLLWTFSQKALLAVALGAGTLVFVPLVGGWVWSFVGSVTPVRSHKAN